MNNKEVASELLKMAKSLVAAKAPRPSFAGSNFEGAIGEKTIKKYEPLYKTVRKLIEKSVSFNDRLKQSSMRSLEEAWGKTKSRFGFQITHVIHTLSINADDRKESSEYSDIYNEMVKISQKDGREEYIEYIAKIVDQKSNWKLNRVDTGLGGGIAYYTTGDGFDVELHGVMYISKGRTELEWGNEKYLHDIKNLKHLLMVTKTINEHGYV